MKKKTLLFLFPFLFLLIGGCVRIEYDATVHYDQSVTLETTYAFRDHPVMKLLNLRLDWETWKQQANDNGYATRDYSSEDDYEGMVLKKTFKNVDELQNIKQEWKTGPAGILVPPDVKFDVQKEDGIWFDSYVLKTNLDLRLDRVDLPGVNLSGSPKELAERYIRQADIRFNLTVPTGVFVEDGTGLDARSMKQVEWQVYGGRQNNMTLVAHVPNVKAWIITIVVAVIASVTAFFVWRRSRKNVGNPDRTSIRSRVLGTLIILLALAIIIVSIREELTNDRKVEAIRQAAQTDEFIPTFAVHGLLGTDRTFLRFSQYMEQRGLAKDGALCTVTVKGAVDCVINDYSSNRPIVRIEYEDAEASLNNQTKWLNLAIEEYKSERNRSFDRMYVIGHSMGGVAAANYILNQDEYIVDKFVTFDSPFAGTRLANFGLSASNFGVNTGSPAIRDLSPSSDGLKSFQAKLETWPRSVQVYSFSGRGGEFNLIEPSSSLLLEEYTNNIGTETVPYDHFSLHRKTDVLRETGEFLYEYSNEFNPVETQ
ncbi:alpha/beta hydrolase [Exiguobacterium sp. SH31]|uniref:alpha/beta hydrolase n=1 Tax=Exiguobacterium sp. SH31 TaxID=1843183 RepID=UPI000B0F8C43|nr:alpha/beta hydrolase [Exiguobacterium sp. SH31]